MWTPRGACVDLELERDLVRLHGAPGESLLPGTMRLPDLSFTLTFASCLVMVGVIWVVQLVHYPLFARVGQGGFPAYHADHTRLITYIVLPTMVVELLTAGALVLDRPGYMPAWVAYAGAALVAAAWAATAFLAVPAHSALSGGFAPEAHRALVLTNWVRTAAWSGRALLLGWVCASALPLHRPLAP